MAKSKPGTEVAETQTGGAAALPEFMQNKAGQGMANIDDHEDIEIPRVKLLQGISPEVNDGLGRAGNFFHTVAEEVMEHAASGLPIIPIYIFKSFILWRPRWQDGGGILARAMDGENWDVQDSFEVQPFKEMPKKKVTWTTTDTVKSSGLDAWGSTDPDDPNSPPAATKMYNIVAYSPAFPHHSPFIVTLQRSSIKVGKKLLGKMKMSSAPTYGRQLLMTSVIEQNSNNEDYYNYNFAQDGFVQDAELFAQMEELYKSFASGGVNIKDVDGLQGEAGEGSSSGESTGPVDERV